MRGIHAQEMIGSKYGRLLVLSISGKMKDGHFKVRCLCDCNKKVEVKASRIKSGSTRSCGCYRIETLSATATRTFTRHGETGKRHAGNRSAEYSSWASMIQRCSNENSTRFKDWGGRGITVCERWMKFENFLFDMGRKPTKAHSIDRVDNSGNYEPLNCRWATPIEQAQNRRPKRVTSGYIGKNWK